MKKTSEIKLKIPPPVVTLAFAALMYLLNSIINFEVQLLVQIWLVVSFLIVASIMLLPAVMEFYKNKTTVNPLKPESASVLVIQGVYRYSRNPMYLGMACILISLFFWIGNPLNIFVFTAYIAYMNRFQIIVEEQALAAIFGEEFELYKTKVRRWI